MAVIGATVAIFAEGASEFRNDHDHGVTPPGADFFGKTSESAAEFSEAISKIAGRGALIDVGVPAAHIDKGKIELLLHQTANPARRELETLR